MTMINTSAHFSIRYDSRTKPRTFSASTCMLRLHFYFHILKGRRRTFIKKNCNTFVIIVVVFFLFFIYTLLYISFNISKWLTVYIFIFNKHGWQWMCAGVFSSSLIRSFILRRPNMYIPKIMSLTLPSAIDAFLRQSTYLGIGLLLCPLCAHKHKHIYEIAIFLIRRMPAVSYCPCKHHLIDHIFMTTRTTTHYNFWCTVMNKIDF